ncbi:MAG: RnfABCDGE type electron transport complex subunit B [Clostridiales bacterium]|nr:RnfABCDGE type electron transport complex subunit B [Clostridiales bacterium]
MNPILIAVLIVSALGLLAGLGLAIASAIMAVPVDEKTEKIEEILPGINCGACGYSGCAGYAKALADGDESDTALCSPGGTEVSVLIARITGLAAGEVMPSAAVVLCQGSNKNTGDKLVYVGVPNCKMATQLFSGQRQCNYGCLGFGDCVAVCDYGAIHICDGVARINPLLCKACEKCVAACPKGLIEMMPLYEAKAAVLCNNREKGAVTRKQCKTGCISCTRCVKACEFDAITMVDGVAKIDYHKCTACGECVTVCPVKAIDMIDMQKMIERAKAQ